jgi:hypothetical protein
MNPFHYFVGFTVLLLAGLAVLERATWHGPKVIARILAIVSAVGCIGSLILRLLMAQANM